MLPCLKKAVYVLILLFASAATVLAQSNPINGAIPKRQYYTKKLPSPVKLDGLINEPAWDAVEWSGEFIQVQPNENTKPSVETHFKILYDEKFLYIAYQCFDSTPGSIVKRMGRRDEFPGDWMEINIDSHHDLRTAFSFTLSVSGVRGDEAVTANGNNWDGNWNPIWFAKTHIDSQGWTAEVKIPFSQLRYGNEEDKVWGIQVQRRLFRKEERSYWQYIPQSSGVWVSAFGELRGLKGIPAQKQIEIAPYVVAQTAKYKKEDGNPFSKGTDSKISAGVDGKVAVTSDLILDFTVNPDFGQVEADPSQVRIDGFQNFFEERRPFFIESRSIFDYQVTGSSAGGDYDADLLFYSRRIGGSPHRTLDLNPGEYAKMPDNTHILGAAKFSGKTKDGWSIGVLESVTQREHAVVDTNGERHDELVEPLTSYFVARAQKDINDGKTVLGGIFTAVNREKGLDDILHSRVFSGGLDFLHYWNKRHWYYKGDIIFSRVEGSKEAIYNTQTAFEHLFQRSDNTEATLDPNRTSLSGTGGTFKIGKNGGKSGKLGEIWVFEAGATWRSPGLELNDIGFMLSADEINHFAWGGVQFQQPFSIFRNARISYNHWARWDFSGQFLYLAFNVNGNALFKNYWQAGLGFTWNPFEISNVALRGATSLRKPAGMGESFNVNTDTRKKVYGSLNVNNFWGNHYVSGNDYSVGISSQPIDALSIGLSVGYSDYFRKQDQYVSAVDYGGTTRTIVSEVNQRTVRVTLRINYNITPELTIQYYGQPYITRPTFANYGYVIDPLNADYDSRFHRYNANEIKEQDGTFIVDENHDGKIDYSFNKPDFNFVQFRSNLVVRWEYRPGSELYLVWSQGNTPDVARDLNTRLGNSLLENSFTNDARNIFLVKFTYRFLK